MALKNVIIPNSVFLSSNIYSIKNGAYKKEAGEFVTYGHRVDGQLEGAPVITKWKSGESFVGTYKKDKRDGNGTWKGRNGVYYSGNWENGVRSGFGEAIGLHSRYKGLWKDGKPHNQGEI